MIRLSSFVVLLSLVSPVSSAALAAPRALSCDHAVDLADFKGRTFLETMMADGQGIKAQLDDDYETPYVAADWRTVRKTLTHFDDKISRKVLRDGEAPLHAVVDALAGKKIRPSGMVDAVRKQLKGRGDVFAIAQLIAMASGAGTLVQIDADNYYYNYGYKSGTNPADDVKSGRSFGAGPNHNANDASDVFYLGELDAYLGETQNPRPFYEAMLGLLLETDPAGFGARGMTAAAQTVATDFIAIYTAESDRHIMVDLNPRKHPWENDLAEVTLVSAYGVAAGKVMKDGQLVDGSAKEYWAKSQISNRSGIGQTRKDRRKLQALISAYERAQHPELVEAIEKLIGGAGPGGDVYQGLMEYLNDSRTQASVRRHARALKQAVADFIVQTAKDAGKITPHVLKNI